MYEQSDSRLMSCFIYTIEGYQSMGIDDVQSRDCENATH